MIASLVNGVNIYSNLARGENNLRLWSSGVGLLNGLGGGC